ncbi:MAG TPA: acetyl-CoA C-acetyltransferase [Casimicrobiaceae bacterium]|jgi:acetyl-CoA C-acetyltransferase|nr:acetyl-CoA C-acetyltransferase [Casimicrobiaceae bacterium]
MPDSLRPVAVLGSARIPFARANGAYVDASNQDMLTAALAALVDKFRLRGETVGEVAAGAVLKHSRDWNLTREALQGAGLDPHTPAYDVQRACGTSLTTTVQVAQRIARGEIEVGIAGGVDTVSDAPIAVSAKLRRILLDSARGRSLGARLSPWLRLRPSDLKPSAPAVSEPRTGLSMGEHCELMAKEWQIGRGDQDALAYQSHVNAAAAWRDGFYTDLVVPFAGLAADNNVRADTSPEKLAALKPAYDRSASGTLTAGNSTPLTDGAACVLLASEAWARARGCDIQAYLTHSAVAAVDYAGLEGPREGLLMAPAYAVPIMLDRAGIKLPDFDVYEIHEAFAAQVLCTLKAWESESYCRTRLSRSEPLGSIDRAKLNPRGGSVALGHPFAATGARIVGTLAKELALRGSGRGLISICTAGGMGVTAILER